MQGAFSSLRALPFLLDISGIITLPDLCYISESPVNVMRSKGRKLMHPEIKHLLGLLDEAYKRAAWHGPNLRGSIRGLTAREAAWRPKAGRHNIWEIVVHAAYWKYTVTRRLLGEKRGSFSLQGSNWFVRPTELTEEAWRTDVALLEETHRTMRAAIAAFAPAELHKTRVGSKVNNLALI